MAFLPCFCEKSLRLGPPRASLALIFGISLLLDFPCLFSTPLFLPLEVHIAGALFAFSPRKADTPGPRRRWVTARLCFDQSTQCDLLEFARSVLLDRIPRERKCTSERKRLAELRNLISDVCTLFSGCFLSLPSFISHFSAPSEVCEKLTIDRLLLH